LNYRAIQNNLKREEEIDLKKIHENYRKEEAALKAIHREQIRNLKVKQDQDAINYKLQKKYHLGPASNESAYKYTKYYVPSSFEIQNIDEHKAASRKKRRRESENTIVTEDESFSPEFPQKKKQRTMADANLNQTMQLHRELETDIFVVSRMSKETSSETKSLYLTHFDLDAERTGKKPKYQVELNQFLLAFDWKLQSGDYVLYSKKSCDVFPLQCNIIESDTVVQIKDDICPSTIDSRHSSLDFSAQIVLGSKFHVEEGNTVEFKNVSSASRNLISNIMKYVLPAGIAFLNSNGGRIFIGVGDNGNIIGVNLDANQRDALRCAFGSSFQQLEPVNIVALVVNCIKFHKILFHSFGGNLGVVKEHYVVEFSFPRLRDTHRGKWCKMRNGTSYVRLLNSKTFLNKEKTTENERWAEDKEKMK
jgi:hypothetical protein